MVIDPFLTDISEGAEVRLNLRVSDGEKREVIDEELVGGLDNEVFEVTGEVVADRSDVESGYRTITVDVDEFSGDNSAVTVVVEGVVDEYYETTWHVTCADAGNDFNVQYEDFELLE